MASTVALFTGLTGLNSHSRRLDVIGNNIANVNTTAFKSTRMLFSTNFSRTISEGAEPQDVAGGRNPSQIGYGVTVAGVQRDFRDGTISTTGDPRDLAIEGNGLFIVRRNEETLYTRAGAFRQDSEGNLVTISGERLQGYGVDENYNIVDGTLTDLQVPVGTAAVAQATQNVHLSGNLNAAGDLPSAGSVNTITATPTSGFSLIDSAPAVPMGADTLMTDLADPDDPSGETPLFEPGQTLQLDGARKGSKLLPVAEFAIEAASTLGDMFNFLNSALGIRTDVGTNPDGRTPGVTIDSQTGIMSIVGNTGTANDITMRTSDFDLISAGGQSLGSPFVSGRMSASDGESIRTTFLTHDSLGAEVEVDIAIVLNSRGENGTSWRYYIDSADDSAAGVALSSGIIQFDEFGRLTTTTPVAVDIDRSTSGAESPLSFDLHFAAEDGEVTALADIGSSVAANFQDGAPAGTLAGFGVEQDGTILGQFTNGLQRDLGRVVIGVVANPDGLIAEGENFFSTGPNSGLPAVREPGQLGAARLVSGALEQSNVDLGREFIELILTSTGYSASSRVIRTADELMQQLLVLGR